MAFETALGELLLLIISTLVLGKASEIAVNNAVKLSIFFRISTLALGFLLLAILTTLPELSVSVTSSVMEEGAIAGGNAFGSVTTNILLILGLGGFLYGIKISPKTLVETGLVLVATTVISAYIILNSFVQGKALGSLEGAVLLAMFGIFVWRTMKQKRSTEDHRGGVKKERALYAFILLIGSFFVVIISSAFVVESAVRLAKIIGVAESFIGASIIAAGTSLPELAICLQAVKQRHYNLALGNVIGANMSDMTLVLGTAAVINPLSVQLSVFIAILLFAIVANILLIYLAATRKEISKFSGAVFLLIYCLYLFVISVLQFRELEVQI